MRLQRKVAGIKQAHVSSASVELVPIPQAKSSLGLILKNLVELTNDPFDDVEIREIWRGGDENGMPAAEHASAQQPPSALAGASFHLLSQISHGGDAVPRMRIPTRRALAINGREQ